MYLGCATFVGVEFRGGRGFEDEIRVKILGGQLWSRLKILGVIIGKSVYFKINSQE